MSNAVIYLHPDGYETSGPRLLGRHSAGESFLRGYLRHADVERHHFWNAAGRPQRELEDLLARIEPPRRPVEWIGRGDRSAVSAVGVLNLPAPDLSIEAWQRRLFGSRAYAICGITHTTATAIVMRLIGDMLIAPLDEHDALICTSSAVREAVEIQLTEMRAYMRAEYGPRRRPEPQRVTIPLGVNVADFKVSEEHRRAWREKLGIPDEAVVALYVGRFNTRGKMNPALMAMALERAAQRTGRPIAWVNSGWGETAKAEAIYHEESRKLCPSVQYIHVDGRPPDVRFSIWSVGDVFISFSDNIQETFGLTPVEAMAAGLPCVVTDWNGYKDTVRHEVDGFRVPTIAPRPGLGGDLAYAFAGGWLDYDDYVGATAQYVAADLGAADEMISALVLNEDLRRRMGASARQRAREVFDWAAIIPQYQALWAEQDARRKAAGPDPAPRSNPYRPEPYVQFQNYPTRRLAVKDRLVLRPAMTPAEAKARLAAPLAAYSAFNRLTVAEIDGLFALLEEKGSVSVAEVLATLPPTRRPFVERGLLWLARHDVIAIEPAA